MKEDPNQDNQDNQNRAQFYRPPGVDPHRGKEAELMAQGAKKLSVFWGDEAPPEALFRLQAEGLVAHRRFSVKRPAGPSGRLARRQAAASAAGPAPRSGSREPRVGRAERVLWVDLFWLVSGEAEAGLVDLAASRARLETLLRAVLSGTQRADEAVEREIGTLLGYEPEAIEAFIQWKADLAQSLPGGGAWLGDAVPAAVPPRSAAVAEPADARTETET